MRPVLTQIMTVLALTGCTPPSANDNIPPTSASAENDLLPTKVAWRKCQFELDKVEAVRGRNLDDLNRGMAVARNQFLMDCMGATADEMTKEQFDEMAAYARRSDASKNSDPTYTSLNNGLPRH